MTKDSTHADKALVREKPPAAPGETLGCYLKKHRLQQNRKVEEIAGKLRLQPAILIAIEENNLAALPAEVFARGFIKSYALQLGLDPEEALRWHIRQTTTGGRGREEKFNVQEVLASEELAHAPSFRWKRILFLAFLIFFLAALASLLLTTVDLSSLNWNDSEQQPVVEEPARKLQPAPPAGELKVPETDAPPTPGQNSVQDSPLAPAAGPPKALSAPGAEKPRPPSSSLPLVPEKTKPSPAAAPVAPPPSSAAVPSEIAGKQVLSAEFSDTTWLQVQLDSEKPQAFTYRRGDRTVWQADKRITLFIGNAGGVSLLLNNREVPPLGKPGQPVRVSFPRN